jgi:hypothetical protein
MKLLIIGVCILIAVIFYSMCVVAGRCDEKMGIK